MDNYITPTNYLINSIIGIISLSIYWEIVYFLYTSTFKYQSILSEHLLKIIEFISAIAIIIYKKAFKIESSLKELFNLNGKYFFNIMQN